MIEILKNIIGYGAIIFLMIFLGFITWLSLWRKDKYGK